MKKSPIYNKYCYYCICTACNSQRCPHRRKLFKECNNCQEYGFKPRLFCDYFSHFAKKYHYRVKRVSLEQAREQNKLVLRISNNHIIICNGVDDLERLRKRYPLATVELMRIELPSDEDNRRK